MARTGPRLRDSSTVTGWVRSLFTGRELGRPPSSSPGLGPVSPVERLRRHRHRPSPTRTARQLTRVSDRPFLHPPLSTEGRRPPVYSGHGVSSRRTTPGGSRRAKVDNCSPLCVNDLYSPNPLGGPQLVHTKGTAEKSFSTNSSPTRDRPRASPDPVSGGEPGGER